MVVDGSFKNEGGDSLPDEALVSIVVVDGSFLNEGGDSLPASMSGS